MIISKLKGGLGNQMFQYAVGLFMAVKYEEELKLDSIGYDDPRYIMANTPRVYRLFPFNLKSTLASKEEIDKYRNPFGIISKLYRLFDQKILRNFYIDYDASFFNKKHKYIEGFFQSEKNFIEVKDKVIESFTLKEEYISENFLKEKNKIDKENSVSIHIRRGDYVKEETTSKRFNVYSKGYYDEAMELIKSKIDSPIFYFFSDDIEWVKKEFGEQENFHFVSNGKLEDYEELLLMSTCNHNIIANSSFSWWGAYLNQNKDKIVIAPNKWSNMGDNSQPNIIPETWIRL
jgi:hypothetical protein